MILVIPTICHTGSRFVTHELFDGRICGLKKDPKDGFNYFDHLHGHNLQRIIELMDMYPAVIPLRHPRLCAVSWMKRGARMLDMIDMWYSLVLLLDKFSPYYLPIDSPDRNDYLDELNVGLELNIKTNWPIVNSKHNTTCAEDLGVYQEQVDFLCKDIAPFLNRFYPKEQAS